MQVLYAQTNQFYISYTLAVLILSETQTMAISTGWAELPQDLLHLLMDRIVCLPSFIRFGAVCWEWHLLVSTNKVLHTIATACAI